MTATVDASALPVRLEIAVRRLGLAPLLALMCLAGAAGAWLWSATAAREAAALRDELAAPPVVAPVKAVPASASQAGLPAYQQRLGDGRQAERHVRALFRAARASGLHLSQGEYRWVDEPALAVERYQVRLPVKGSYAAVRAFCERVLVEMPFAALDGFEMQRESIGDDSLTATLQFSFHLRAGGRS